MNQAGIQNLLVSKLFIGRTVRGKKYELSGERGMVPDKDIHIKHLN